MQKKLRNGVAAVAAIVRRALVKRCRSIIRDHLLNHSMPWVRAQHGSAEIFFAKSKSDFTSRMKYVELFLKNLKYIA